MYHKNPKSPLLFFKYSPNLFDAFSKKISLFQVCEDSLAVHSRRLAELRQLVAGIASAVGLDANALLGGEVEALGKRLEDVRESLTQLADVAEGKLNAKNEAKKQINGQRTFLDSVQKVSRVN